MLRCSRRYTRDIRASIHTRRQCRTCIRIFFRGSFTGKGIYDVDAFEEATHGRFPENTLLSHDLIEGAYSRAALATDIEVYDDYPARYLTYTRRKHRWIRGDWQLLQWLGNMVPGPQGPELNRLSAISRWKIFDNLRRSLIEISQLLLLFAGWFVLSGPAIIWTLIVLGTIAFPGCYRSCSLQRDHLGISHGSRTTRPSAETRW